MDPNRHTIEELKAEELKRLVSQRIKVEPHERLQCPRERSEWTPCLARDGWTALTQGGLCVGCGHAVGVLLEEERARHGAC